MRLKAITGIVLTVFLLGMLTLAFNIQPAKAEPTTIIVPDDYPTIQEAINHAYDGDTVFVRADIYYEHLTIGKSISLIGEDKYNTVIDGSGTGNVIYVTAGNVDISGFTIQNGGLNWREAGIFLKSSVGDTISNNIMSNNYWGIHLEYSSMNNTICNNEMTSNNASGIYLDYHSPNNTIKNNTVSNNGGVGITIIDCDGNIISDNTVTLNDGLGFEVRLSSNTLIRNNTISNNEGDGIVLPDSNDTTISNNTIISNTGDGIHFASNNSDIVGNVILDNRARGIQLEGFGGHNTISGNTINNSWQGMRLYNSENNIISGNTISNNLEGIRLDSSSNSKFYHNNLIDNTIQVSSINSVNTWDDGFPSGGNYWSDNVCDGNPSNGSQPYIIDENNIDHYPFQDPNVWINTLTIYSSPAGVTFTVNDVSRTAPWSETYSEGTSVSLAMPEIHTFGDARYYWSQWSDENTSRLRTVTMTTNITLTAYYTGPYYELTVTSSPITGITFIINGTSQTTPYTEWLPEGSYTLITPETDDGYVWSHWLEDGDPNRTKTVTMDTNITLTAVFTPPDTTPPTISIVSPENKTYTTSSVPLSFTVDEATSWIGYSLDGQANITIAENTTLTGLSDGTQTLIVYASDIAGNMGSSDIVHFTIGTTPPSISIVSPENKTYDTTDIPLTFTVDESVLWMAYSLDGQANMTITGNTTLSGLSDGSHSLKVYAKDTAGNMGFSGMVYFSIQPLEVQVGVKTGDWIKYDYSITGAPSGTVLPTWIKVEFLSVEGTNATVRITMHMSDGTEQSDTMTINIMAGEGTLGTFSGFVIPANCTTGDSIYISGYGDITIADETTRTYAGASRTVVYTSFSQYETELTYYWDKQTGVMVEASVISGGITGTAKATETNMLEAAPSPFLMQWWLWAIVAVAIIALAGAVYFLKKRKSPTPTAHPLPPEGTV